uniref:Pentatricopeptide repeat-containing protein n=1 Tax=Ananas comosus var. bracteatus TaxID=296719 RepID=A0A6V7QBS4_ANACO|nr:unnamed protein product [Ananas comosus var. bracteatus]
MLRSPARPDVCTFNTIIRGLCLNSALGDAFRLFHDMPRRHRCPPTSSPTTPSSTASAAPAESPPPATCSTVCAPEPPPPLPKYRSEDGFGEEDVGDDGFKPDTCTFNTLIAAHCKMGKIDDALKVFDRMLELRVKRDSASYSTVMRALCESGEFRRAEGLVDELLEKEVLKRRGVCVPLVAAYNPIFEYLCRNGKAKKAKVLFQQLLDRRGKLDFAAFKTLILGHCKEGAFEEGLICWSQCWQETLFQMPRPASPSTSVFHLVLSGLLEKEKYANEASNLVAVMLERKIRQNIDLSTKVVSGLFSNGLNERAFKIIRSLYDNGYYVKMDKLVENLCIEKKFLEARELLLFSLDARQKIDSVVFASVLNGLCRAGRASEAFTLFYGMIDKGSLTVPSDCLVALRVALQEAGRLKEADFVGKQMRRAIT